MSTDIVQKTKIKLQELGQKKQTIVKAYIKELEENTLQKLRQSLGLHD